MHVKVFHLVSQADSLFYDHVANVNVGDGLSEEDTCEVAFQATQNLFGSWSREQFIAGKLNEDWNDNVDRVADLHHLPNREELGIRSTMAKDIIELENGHRYYVLPDGFKKIADS